MPESSTYYLSLRWGSLRSQRSALDELRRYLDGPGIDLSAMDNEAVRKAVEASDGIRLEQEPGPFSVIVAGSYADNVTRAISAPERGRGVIAVSQIPAVLRVLGVPELPVVINQATIQKMHFDHGLTEKVIQRLPQLMADPTLVFDSESAEGAFTLILDIDVGGNPLLVAFNPDQRRGRHEVNVITSAYGKQDVKVFGRWANKGLLRYVNPKKNPEWSTKARLQLPGMVHSAQGVSKKVIGPDDVVKVATRSLEQKARGSLTISPDRQMTIALLKVIRHSDGGVSEPKYTR